MKLKGKYFFFVAIAFFLCWTNLAYCEVSAAVLDLRDHSLSYHSSVNTQALFIDNILTEESDVEESDDDDLYNILIAGPTTSFLEGCVKNKVTSKNCLHDINCNSCSISLVILYHSWRHHLIG